MSMAMSTEEKIRHYQRSIDRSVEDKARLLHCINVLSKLPVTVQHLQNTGIGRTVNALRKIDEGVGDAAKSLVSKWKYMVANTDTSEEEDEACVPDVPESYDSPECDCEPEKSSNDVQTNGPAALRIAPPVASSIVFDEDSPPNLHSHLANNGRKVDSDDQNEEPEKTHDNHNDDTHEEEQTTSHKSSSSKDKHASKSSKHSSKSSTKDRSSNKESDKSKSTHKHTSKYDHKHKHKSSKSDKDSENSDHKSKDRSKSKSESSQSSSPSTSKEKKHGDENEKKRKHDSSSSDEESCKKKKMKVSSDEEDMDTDNFVIGADRSSDDGKQEDMEVVEDHKEKKRSSSSHSKTKDSSLKGESQSDKSKSKDEHRTSNSNSSKAKSSCDTVKKDERHSTSKSDERGKESKSKSDDHRSKESSKSKTSHSSSSSSSKDKENDRDKDKHGKDKAKESSSKSQKDDKERSKSKDKEHKSKSKDEQKEHKKHKESNDSKEHKEKNKVKKTASGDGEIDCNSGTSFADALGMCTMLPPSSKKKKENTSSSLPKSSKTEKHNSSGSSTPTNNRASTSKINNEPPNSSDALPLLSPNIKLGPLPIEKEVDISSTLAEPSVRYEPLPPTSKICPIKRKETEAHLLSLAIYTKSARTKVYSGNKTGYTNVPTLYDMCIRVLIENIDALEYTGGVPYYIIKPVLERATPDQLFMLEHHNPYLIEESGSLWQYHCNKDFRNKHREEMESWREMYMRCLDEREAKLKALTANIKQSIDKSTPVRSTKLAYVDNVVKPPRSVLRKQAKYGTANTSSKSSDIKKKIIAAAAGPSSGASSNVRISVPPPPTSRARMTSSSTIKKQKAPLMAKALQAIRGRYKR